MKQICTYLFIVLFFLIQPIQASAIKVVIDAGHGGYNPGAVSEEGLEEKHVNLDIAYKLEQELIRRGYETVMLRPDDNDISLAERVRQTREYQPDLFISIHANHHPDAFIRGSMVLYYDSQIPQATYPPSDEMVRLSPESRKFAQSVLDAIISRAGTENRGLLPSAAYVIRMGSAPSILVETAFLSNPDDARLLADDAFRRLVAEGIAIGIEDYRPAHLLFPDIASHWAKESILRLESDGIVRGIGQSFQPDRPMTRAEYLTMLDRIFRLHDYTVGMIESGEQTSADRLDQRVDSPEAVHPQPADLSTDHWAYASLQAGLTAGIILGYPDGNMRPDSPVTRSEAAVMLDRTMAVQPFSAMMGTAETNEVAKSGETAGIVDSSSIRQLFDDVSPASWSAPSVYRLAIQGILLGISPRIFEPDRQMTRAESAVMLDRYLHLPR